jgi:hypothetical protein
LFKRPPRSKHREYLFKKLAWRVQELRFGGLSATAKKRLEELASEIVLPETVVRTRDGIAVGTELVREWRRREYRVVVRDNGYEYEGTIHRSLTAVAKAITGSHWNGRLFFGLTERTQ